MRGRLAAANAQWDAVCEAAGAWQAKLQHALMANAEFHSTVADLLQVGEELGLSPVAAAVPIISRG